MSSRRYAKAFAFVLPFLLYLALPAATMNGDGFGYHSRALSPNWFDKLVPGHLLYIPLLAGIGRLAPAFGMTPANAMLLINQVAGAGAVGFFFLTAGRCRLSLFGQCLAATGLGTSFGFWIQATDLEAYALAVFFVVVTLYAVTRFIESAALCWIGLAGVCTGLAALFHLVTATLGATALLAIVLVRGKRSASALGLYLATAAVVFGIPVATIGFGLQHLSSMQAVTHWLLSADHGFKSELGLMSLPRAAYGFARTIVVLESLWSASHAWIAVKAGALVVATGWLGWQGARFRRQLSPEGRTLLLALIPFTALQTLLGVWYFGSDSERWIFIMPVVWLAIGAIVATLPVRKQVIAATGVAILGAVNLCTGIGPLATDHSTEERVRVLVDHAEMPTLVITPGHDWLSYLSFYAPDARHVEVMSLFALARKHEGNADALFREVTARMDDANRQGRSVLLIRVLDPQENFREDPWQLLETLNCGPRRLQGWFQQRTWEGLCWGEGKTRLRVYRLSTEAEERLSRMSTE